MGLARLQPASRSAATNGSNGSPHPYDLSRNWSPTVAEHGKSSVSRREAGKAFQQRGRRLLWGRVALTIA
jgi:hypothetical protein